MKTPSWLFDGSPIPDPFGYGERAVTWLRRLRHPKNPQRGNPFTLDPWQERIIRRLYGPRHGDGSRVVRRLVLLLPRGNRKTALAAALTLLHLCGPESTPGGLIVSAASAREQSKELYREAALIVQHDRRLAKHLRVKKSTSVIEFAAKGAEYRAVSADGGVQHGKTPAVVIADELHVWKGQAGRDLWEALDSALVKTPNTLMIVATTSGRGQENLAWEVVDYAQRVQDGLIDDPATLPVIFAAEKDDDWRAETVWHAVNPGLRHGYPDLPAFRDRAAKAEHSPGDRDGFLQFNLNVWLDKSTSGFVDMAVYDEGSARIDLASLDGRSCWVGVDMSTTTDLSAVVAAFPDDEGGFTVLPHFFVPADNLRGRADRDGVPYPTWAAPDASGRTYITATAGSAIDPRAVESCIRDLASRYRVEQIGFDPAYSQAVAGPLLDEGFPVVTVRQGWVTQAPALNVLEAAIVSRQLRHDGNPVLRWCFANVAVHTDGAGNRTMHKGKSTDRIDGAVAAWMAVWLAAQGASSRSAYEDPAHPLHALGLAA